MIRLEEVSYAVRDHAGRRIVLNRASFGFGPGIYHIAAAPTADARLLVQLLAGHRAPGDGRIRCSGPRSWPMAQFAPFGIYLTGLDGIDVLCSLYALDRPGTFRLFRELMTEPEWLRQRLDRWPSRAQRQFGQIALLAPVFDSYLLDLSPVYPEPNFQRRWAPLFRQRIAGRTVIIASGEHRAALRQFPGRHLLLTGGTLHQRD
ncbi:MAG: hypothetical protein ACREE3_17105, partial [Stellaceae bacterium]